MKQSYFKLTCHAGFQHFMCNLSYGLDYIAQTHGQQETKINIHINSNSWGNFDEFFITKTFKVIKEDGVMFTEILPSTGGWLQEYGYGKLLVDDVELRPFIKKKIKDYIDVLGEKYVAIHCRFGDRSGNFGEINLYEDLMQKCLAEAKKTNTNILLCTDNLNFINQFKDEKNVFNFSVFKDIDTNKSLHCLNKEMFEKECKSTSKYEFNLSTIIDFYLMVLSNQLVVCANGNYSRGAAAVKRYFKDKNLNLNNLI